MHHFHQRHYRHSLPQRPCSASSCTHRLANQLPNRRPCHRNRGRRRCRNPPNHHNARRCGRAAHKPFRYGHRHYRHHDWAAIDRPPHNAERGLCRRVLHCRLGLNRIKRYRREIYSSLSRESVYPTRHPAAESAQSKDPLIYRLPASRGRCFCGYFANYCCNWCVHLLLTPCWILLSYPPTVANLLLLPPGFPVLIIALIPFRIWVIPKWFSHDELEILDDLTANNKAVLASFGGRPRFPGQPTVEELGRSRRHSEQRSGVERQRSGHIHR